MRVPLVVLLNVTAVVELDILLGTVGSVLQMVIDVRTKIGSQMTETHRTSVGLTIIDREDIITLMRQEVDHSKTPLTAVNRKIGHSKIGLNRLII